MEGLLVGKTFWRAIWQPVSKASVVFDLVILLLGVYPAETVQAKVGKMHVYECSQQLRYLLQERGEGKGELGLGGNAVAGSHREDPDLGLVIMTQ